MLMIIVVNKGFFSSSNTETDVYFKHTKNKLKWHLPKLNGFI